MKPKTTAGPLATSITEGGVAAARDLTKPEDAIARRREQRAKDAYRKKQQRPWAS